MALVLTDIMSRATLIICPASLIDHWLMEIEERVKKDKLQVLKYHGRSRPKKVEKYKEKSGYLNIPVLAKCGELK